MAVVRARSAPPYPLILFVILWVISTALAVMFYLGQSKAQTTLQDREKQYSEAAHSSDAPIIQEFLKERTDPQASAIQTADNQIKALLKTIGAPSATPDDVTTPKNGLAATAVADAGHAGGTLLGTIQALRTELQTQTDAVANLNTSVNSLKQQAQATKQNYDTAIAAAQDTIKKMTERNTALTEQLTALRNQNQQSVASNEDSMNKLRDQMEELRRQQLLNNEQQTNEIARRDDLIRVLREQLQNERNTRNTNLGAEPDGIIVRAGAGTGEVYINLGRRDRVVPGLTFAVYDPRLGVRLGSDANPQEAAGKGGIEVMDVAETESLCRITHTTSGQTIAAGDLIANPVYHQDRTRTFRFVVIGDFDLDGDGVATAGERDRLTQMIKRWGGVIDPNVTTQTDFVVVGKRPASAETPATDEAAATQPGSVEAVRAQTQQSYDQVIAEAKASSVPILNQNRFLALIGYYSTTIVR
jgi:hypothetical protein